MTSQDPASVLIIAGPTASGKSDLALRVAEALGGEVVNADSMQVYADLPVLSAQPGPADLKRVPHHLYGHVDGSERYSAGRFVRDAVPVLERLRAERRPAILCGGTGLYLRALTEGLSPIPDVPAGTVAAMEALWDRDPAGLRQRLAQEDPGLAARLEPGDRQRHVRAMAVLEATGRPLSHWQGLKRPRPLTAPVRALCLLPPREILYARCDARLHRMVDEGALDEVEALLDRDLAPDLPVMKALGVPQLAAHLRGETSLGEALGLAAQETRRFAKRQVTWFRNQTGWPVFETPDAVVAELTGRP